MRNCDKCGRKKWLKTNKTAIVDGVRVRVWKCSNITCPHEQAEESPFLTQTHAPKKLYFDIETGYDMFYNFGARVNSKYLPIDNLIREGYIICWAAAWLNDADEFTYIISNCVTQAEALRHDDSRILAELWQMMDSADYWIGHNSDKFDIRRVRARFDVHGMGFPYKAKQKDSLKLIRKFEDRISNKLDYLTGGGKQEMSRADWLAIADNGDPAALLKMETYCRHDVRIGADWFRNLVHNIEMSGEKVWA